MKRQTEFLGIASLIIAVIVLLFGDNIFQQLTGRSVFEDNQPPNFTASPIITATADLFATLVSSDATRASQIATPTDGVVLAPIAVLVQYYQSLNNAEHDKAWAMFTPYYQQNQNAKNLEEYKNWAININHVTLSEPITVVEQSDLTATVEIYKVTYQLQSGYEMVYESMEFYLARSSTSGEWLINGIGESQ